MQVVPGVGATTVAGAVPVFAPFALYEIVGLKIA